MQHAMDRAVLQPSFENAPFEFRMNPDREIPLFHPLHVIFSGSLGIVPEASRDIPSVACEKFINYWIHLCFGPLPFHQG